MYKHQITIEIDESMLASYSNEYLATCWHVAQANPADGFATSTPGELAERIGREIIRRWLGDVSPELWHHQGRHHYSHALGKFASYVPPEGVSGGPEWHLGAANRCRQRCRGGREGAREDGSHDRRRRRHPRRCAVSAPEPAPHLTDVPGRLEDHAGVLGVALATWATRDGLPWQSGARGGPPVGRVRGDD